jgi:hypothetical protein
LPKNWKKWKEKICNEIAIRNKPYYDCRRKTDFLLHFRKSNGEDGDSNEFLSLDSNISGKSTSSDNSASGK